MTPDPKLIAAILHRVALDLSVDNSYYAIDGKRYHRDEIDAIADRLSALPKHQHYNDGFEAGRLAAIGHPALRGEAVAWMMTADGYGRPPEFYRERPAFVPPISTLTPLYTAPPAPVVTEAAMEQPVGNVQATDGLGNPVVMRTAALAAQQPAGDAVTRIGPDAGIDEKVSDRISESDARAMAKLDAHEAALAAQPGMVVVQKSCVYCGGTGKGLDTGYYNPENCAKCKGTGIAAAQPGMVLDLGERSHVRTSFRAADDYSEGYEKGRAAGWNEYRAAMIAAAPPAPVVSAELRKLEKVQLNGKVKEQGEG